MSAIGPVRKTATVNGGGTLTVADLRQVLDGLPEKARVEVKQTHEQRESGWSVTVTWTADVEEVKHQGFLISHPPGVRASRLDPKFGGGLEQRDGAGGGAH